MELGVVFQPINTPRINSETLISKPLERISSIGRQTFFFPRLDRRN